MNENGYISVILSKNIFTALNSFIYKFNSSTCHNEYAKYQQIPSDEVISPGNSQCMNCLGTYQIQLSTRVAEKWLNQVQSAVVLLKVFFFFFASNFFI